VGNIRIETTFTNEQIVQVVTGPELDWRTNTRDVISREVMNIKDRQVREALIRMGWTPPKVPEMDNDA